MDEVYQRAVRLHHNALADLAIIVVSLGLFGAIWRLTPELETSQGEFLAVIGIISVAIAYLGLFLAIFNVVRVMKLLKTIATERREEIDVYLASLRMVTKLLHREYSIVHWGLIVDELEGVLHYMLDTPGRTVTAEEFQATLMLSERDVLPPPHLWEGLKATTLQTVEKLEKQRKIYQ